MEPPLIDAIHIHGKNFAPYDDILSPAALEFLVKLQRKFNPERTRLLSQRVERQKRLAQGEVPDFLASTKKIREDTTWHVAVTPQDLQRRWVEITGPTDRKMLINALNSGADVFMADFEDANSPSWKNMVEGQRNLIQAINGKIDFKSPEGKEYKLKDKVAVLMVRPRGWHLDEKHILVDGEPISASLFDFGLYFFHNAKTLLKKGTGPYFYLAKLENHLEARLWNDVFLFAQEELKISSGTIRATVLLETILAAFEMEEILYELREHSSGLNAGRWDYIFSAIKKFSFKGDFIFPDRTMITMTVPFMRAYTELLIKTCHKRGAHAMGGMAAFVPNRKDQAVNEQAMAKVREDKERESKDGFDGTWVAHPDLVPLAREIFMQNLGNKSHQKDRKKEETEVSSKSLLDFAIPGSKITEKGFRQNISIGLQYLDSWLCGIGAAAINNLMEDVATAEICRAQLWQWIHHKAVLEDGRKINEDLYKQVVKEELQSIKMMYGEKVLPQRRLPEARMLLDNLILDPEFLPFLTLSAYELLI